MYAGRYEWLGSLVITRDKKEGVDPLYALLETEVLGPRFRGNDS